jgi:hypothetical protein
MAFATKARAAAFKMTGLLRDETNLGLLVFFSLLSGETSAVRTQAS